MASNQKSPEHVARGLKASIHNDNVSETAKASAARRLEEMGVEVPADYAQGNSTSGPRSQNYDDNDDNSSESGQITGNQARGYKSVISRGDVSEEAKDHARQMLERGVEGQPDNQDKDVGEYAGQGEEISNRALGGYKATLKNPNVSDEAKQNAQEVLEENGASNY